MDRATKIRRAIKTIITGFCPFSETPTYDKFAVIGTKQAALISEAVFGITALTRFPQWTQRCYQ